MDKVIIDGVDVSGCEFYQIEANELYPKAQYCGSMRNTFCENEPNCYYKQLKRLQAEYEDLHLSYAGCKTANNGLQELNQQLQSELQRYKDMEQKGLEEFKDVGGCWGCGLQLQLNQDIEDIKQLKAENERLKARLRPLEDSYFNGLSSIEIAELAKKSIRITAENRKLEDALRKIGDKLDFHKRELEECLYNPIDDEIREIINSVIGAE